MPERMTCASVDTVTSSDPIQVDPRFRAAMPALDDSELEALEESLLMEGCRDALVVWRSSSGRILLDGHNRLAICSRHGVPFDVVEVELSDLDPELERRILDGIESPCRTAVVEAAELALFDPASMVLYFGDDLEGFRDAFGPLGDISVLLQ